MKKSLLSLGLVSLLVAGLSACSLQVRDDTSTTPPPSSAPSLTPDADTGDDDTISGSGFTDGDCTGKDVTIDEDNTTAVLSGNCGAISISASSVFVTVESAESVTVTGTLVDVVVEGTVGAASVGGEQNSYNGGDLTTLEIPGSSVSVIVNNAGSVSISGSTNFVTWSTGAPSASDTGSGNTVVSPF